LLEHHGKGRADSGREGRHRRNSLIAKKKIDYLNELLPSEQY
jgi:hypothetical protein